MATVTGNLSNLAGAPFTDGIIKISLVNTGQGSLPRVIGTNTIIPLYYETVTDANGAFSILLDGNDTIDPANTVYSFSFQSVDGTRFVGPVLFLITGANVNLNTVQAINTMLPAPIYAAFPYVNPLVYPGSDIGAQINAAIAALPTYTTANGAAPVGTLLLPAGIYSYSTSIVCNSPLVTIDGNGSVLNYTGTGTAMKFLDAPTSYLGWGGIRNLQLNGTSSAAYGVELAETTWFTFYNVFIQNFSGPTAAAVYLHDITRWTEETTFNRVEIANSTIGILCDDAGSGQSHDYTRVYSTCIASCGTGIKLINDSIVSGGFWEVNFFLLQGQVAVHLSNTSQWLSAAYFTYELESGATSGTSIQTDSGTTWKPSPFHETLQSSGITPSYSGTLGYDVGTFGPIVATTTGNLAQVVAAYDNTHQHFIQVFSNGDALVKTTGNLSWQNYSNSAALFVHASNGVSVGTSTVNGPGTLNVANSATVGTLSVTGKVTNYNGVVTQGGGVPAEVYQLLSPSLNTNYNAGSAKTLFTPTAVGMWRISYSQSLTTPATNNSTFPSLTLGWTDVGSVARTSTLVSTSTNNANTVITSGDAILYTNNSTPVTITSAGYLSNGATAMVYSLAVTAEQL